MSVPNYSNVPVKLFDTGLYNLKTHDGQAAFTDAVVDTLHGLDPNFRHLKKKPGQTAIHDHGEDSVLYLLPSNQALAVDFIGGANGPNPQPTWQVGSHPYTHADAHDPTDHGIIEDATPAPPSVPSYEAMGGDEGGKRVTRLMEADYKRAEKAGLDGDSGAWQWRTAYDFISGSVPTVDASIAAHQPEWRKALNDERAQNGKPPIQW